MARNVILLYGSIMIILTVIILLSLCYDYIMFLICWCYYLIMLLLYFHFTENSYYSNDIPLIQLVLKRKSELNEEDEILEDGKEEDEEYICENDDEGMCIIFWFVLYYYAWIDLVTYKNYCLSVMKPELVSLQLGYSSKFLCLWYTSVMLLLWLSYAAVMILLRLWYDSVILMVL